MKRPCFALLILLSGLMGPLLVARVARSQPLLDTRVGCIRYDICPFLDDDFYDGGFGPRYVTPAIPRPTDTCPQIDARSRTAAEYTCPLAHRDFDYEAEPAVAPSSYAGDTNDAGYEGATGYDAAYDEAMFGERAPQAVASTPEESWDLADDWCEEPCYFANPAPAPSLRVTFVPMDREPESLAEYYVFYGGDDEAALPVQVFAEQAAEVTEPRLGDASLVDAWQTLVRQGAAWLPWTSLQELHCEWIHVRYTLRHRWEGLGLSANLHEAYYEWLSAATTEVSVDNTIPAVESTPDEVSVRDLGRATLLQVAGSLDQAGQLLQNASRYLTQLVENETPAIPVAVPELD